MFTYQMTMTGGMHRFSSIPCQDYIVIEKAHGIIAACLCDGAGSYDLAGQGAFGMARMISKYIAGDFNQLFMADDDRVRRSILRQIRSTLCRLSNWHDVPEDEFGSTLLAVATDGKYYLAVMLGDGMIISRNANTGCLRPVAMPDRQGSLNATCLTTSSPEEIMSRLRIVRGEVCSEDAFCLTSDGAERALYNSDGAVAPIVSTLMHAVVDTPEMVDDLYRNLVEQKIRPMDDFSTAILVAREPSLACLTGGRTDPTSRRIGRSMQCYLKARSRGFSRRKAASEAGWHPRESKRRIQRLQALGLD